MIRPSAGRVCHFARAFQIHAHPKLTPARARGAVGLREAETRDRESGQRERREKSRVPCPAHPPLSSGSTYCRI